MVSCQSVPVHSLVFCAIPLVTQCHSGSLRHGSSPREVKVLDCLRLLPHLVLADRIEQMNTVSVAEVSQFAVV